MPNDWRRRRQRGGTLATVCAVLARDARHSPCAADADLPGVTGFQDTESHARLANGYLLTQDTIQWFFTQYVRDRADRDDWRFAPLDGTRDASFAGVAPAWLRRPNTIR